MWSVINASRGCIYKDKEKGNCTVAMQTFILSGSVFKVKVDQYKIST
jgi:hypothetical protein